MRATVLFATLLSVLPTLIAADAVADVTAAIGALPQCAQACVAKIPGVTLPVTAAAITSVCNNLQAVVTAYSTCISTSCTNADDMKAAGNIVVALSPVCANLAGGMTSAAGGMTSAAASATGNGTMMMTSATTAAAAKSGAEKIQSVGVVGAAVVMVVAGALVL
ncbi:hypothetical protein HDU76_005365 [Blyttiomyces sp. JEL0837]|nr:hypothetical protein HDU76_005365 [Blyttiomyces sp. JEL0837]